MVRAFRVGAQEMRVIVDWKRWDVLKPKSVTLMLYSQSVAFVPREKTRKTTKESRDVICENTIKMCSPCVLLSPWIHFLFNPIFMLLCCHRAYFQADAIYIYVIYNGTFLGFGLLSAGCMTIVCSFTATSDSLGADSNKVRSCPHLEITYPRVSSANISRWFHLS